MKTFAEKQGEVIRILNAGEFNDIFVKDMNVCDRFVFPRRYAGKNFKAFIIVVPQTESDAAETKVSSKIVDPFSEGHKLGQTEIPLPKR